MSSAEFSSLITVGSLYAGIGGIDKAFMNAGAVVLWANENDKFACITYRRNFSHKLFEEDVYNLDPSKLDKVDILAAGFPCQAFSIAGYQKGFKDERGNHFFRIMQIAEHLNPKIIFLENVKNFERHDKGRTWKIVSKTLSDSGYFYKYKVLNTMHYSSLPQTRERFYAVCFNSRYFSDSDVAGFEFPDKVHKRKKIKDLLEKKNVPPKYFYGPDKYMYHELVKNILKEDTVYQWRRMYVRENKNHVCPTLTANMGTGGHNVPLVKINGAVRKLTPRECFRFQGFDDIILPEEISDAQLYKQAGNSVSVPVVERIAANIIKFLKLHKNE